MPVTSTTSSTGRPNRAAMSAVAPVPSDAPSNRPMTPSPSSRSQPRPLSSSSPAKVSKRMAQGSMLKVARPVAA